MKRLATRVFRRRCRNGCALSAVATCLAIAIAMDSSVASAETLAKADFPDEQAAQQYWGDRERGWFWYREPPRENKEQSKGTQRAAAPTAPARPAALIEFDALQKRVEELRNIAIVRPTERNIRSYLAVQAEVIDKASVFADVAQRVIWANPLKATPDFEPLARGMAAALPYVDDFVSGHSISALEELAAKAAPQAVAVP